MENEKTSEKLSMEQLIDKYHVDVERYKVLRDQVSPNENKTWDIDSTATKFISDTARLIDVIGGHNAEKDWGGAFDAVVYLDKSARPAYKLVDTFWDVFAKDEDGKVPEKPKSAFLAIDRGPEFRKVGMPVDSDGVLMEDWHGCEKGTVADFSMYQRAVDDLSGELRNDFEDEVAGIRALFTKEEVDLRSIKQGDRRALNEALAEAPTKFDDKRILIVDEFSRSGSTLKIAQYLVQKALGASDENVQGVYFWSGGPTYEVVWYDPKSVYGRGIGEVDSRYYQELNERKPTSENYKKALARNVLAAPLAWDDKNIAKKKDQRMIDLIGDMKTLKEDYLAGKIVVSPSVVARNDYDRAEKMMSEQGFSVDAQGRWNYGDFIQARKSKNARS